MFDFFEYLGMLDQQSLSGPNAQTSSVGTGAFSLVEWVQGDHLTFARNPNYWKAGRPYLDGVQFSITPDLQALVTRFEAGAFDLIKTPPLRDYVRLKADPHYQGVEHPTDGRYFLFGVNVTRPPLDNKQVRQALNWALDRQRSVNSATLGVGTPKTLPWPTTSPAYDAAKDRAYAFDLARARSLLNGLTFSIDCVLQSGNAELTTAAQVYQSDLAQVGVTLNIQTVALAAWLDQVNNRKYNGVYASTDSRTALSPLTYYTSTPVFNPTTNNEGFTSQAYTDLVTAAGVEADPAKQKQIYAQVNDLWLDESFVIPLSTASGTLVLLSTAHGLNHNMRAGWLFTNMWLQA
jgi:peptide/nickel transport system substrate-binding protein